jgi:hypothetical protein
MNASKSSQLSIAAQPKSVLVLLKASASDCAPLHAEPEKILMADHSEVYCSDRLQGMLGSWGMQFFVCKRSVLLHIDCIGLMQLTQLI